MSKLDVFGDRMKDYEQKEAGRKFLPMLPICVRLDGKGFSKFTKKMNRPYEEVFSHIMVEVTKYLVEHSGAKIGYTQSDEISLVLYADDYKQNIYFDGKIQKITSTLASVATAVFNKLANELLPIEKRTNEYAFFDCRAWEVPNLQEAANTLLWREFDATKNSVSMAARSYYSHKQVLHKNTNEMKDMLMAKGVNWNDYPAFFKRGTYVQKQQILRELTKDELAKIPVQYQPKEPIVRSEIVSLDMPIFSKVVNRVDVIFKNAKPIVAVEDNT